MKSKKRFANIIIVVLILIFFMNIKMILKNIYPIYFNGFVAKYSEEYELDPYFVFSVIKAESNFEVEAESHKDAKGLMQITPSTGEWIAEQIGVYDFDVEMLQDPETNIRFGCWYLNDLREEFGDNNENILAAYNAGRGNVNKWLLDKEISEDGETLVDIPFNETDKYIKKVLVNYNIYQFIYEDKKSIWSIFRQLFYQYFNL
ncbi:lytic transglycosylase domain-containing protein [Clostridium sp. DL1XJH146]